jgi:hypothetical protein
LVSLVLVDVSSIKTSRANALLKKRLRCPIHRSRARAISGRNCSLARRLFFIAQPKPIEEPANRRTVDRHAASSQFDAQFIQCHFAVVGNTFGNPRAMRVELAAWRVALPGRRNRARSPVQDHHVVDEPRRHPEVPGSLSMAVAFFNKRNHTRTQLDRMRLAHGSSPSIGKVNHKSGKNGILNQIGRDTL